ncbi:contractile injection system protein, VgrG/Pvc8 family [Oceanobacter mangrovi]|uniref:contractile injection system protein, VgrG/Pvc8 family n=1 Tax=Oceanobacter mangrovi TaxID=2862510 RepID=UPI001C8DA678|nr:contractile injection system protein, VgrG/Pvc8 family [Oceanobacter mangrovi]
MSAAHRPMSIAPMQSSQPLTVVVEGDQSLPTIGADYIRLDSLQGQEAISQPFKFQADIRADDSLTAGKGQQLLDSRYLGRWVQFGVQGQRWFRGLLTELNQAAPGCYSLTVESPLALLNLRNRYHIYEQCTVESLLQAVFAQDIRSGKLLLQFDLDDSLTLTRRQDWLQAGETDLEFIQRIIGKFSLYYFFVHQQSSLTLVFSDKTASRQGQARLAGASAIPDLRYTYTSIDKLGSQQNDLFCDLAYNSKLMPANVQSMLGRVEASWDTNRMAICDATPWADNNQAGNTAFLHHQYFDYGADSAENTGKLTKLCQQINTTEGTLSGTATTPLLGPGYSFTLSDPLLDNSTSPGGRPEFAGQSFVVTSIQHKVSATTPYTGGVQATQLYLGTDPLKQTLLTPFSIQNTHQGSVLAKVTGTTPPQSQYFMDKSNLSPQDGQVDFDDQTFLQRGCTVQLVTGEEFWIVLPRTSTSVPEVNSLVMISRGNNNSEQPEVQVLSSHGSKTVTPPGRRKASWTVNGSWGSSYSTSYGDNISIRYGHGVSTALNGGSSDTSASAQQLVESAYDKPGVGGVSYGGASYSKDSGWSLQQSPGGDSGILSASISQGSSYNESHAAVSYGISNTGTSQSRSNVGKSVNCSTIGDYDGVINFSQPSFINGYIPDSSIVDLANQLSNGDTYSETHIKGRSINLTGHGMKPPSWGDKSASQYSNSAMLGNSVNNSLTLGNSSNSSIQIGNVSGANLFLGNRLDTSLTLGTTTAVNTNIGASARMETNISANATVATNVSANSTLSTTVGATSNVETFIGARSNVETSIAANNNVATRLGLNNTVETFLGARNSVSTNISANNTVDLSLGANSTVATFIGTKSDVITNLSATSEVKTNIGSHSSIGTYIGTKLDIDTQLATTSTISTVMGLNLVVKNNMSTLVESQISAAATVKLEQAPAAVQTIMQTMAKISSTEAEVLNGIRVIL